MALAGYAVVCFLALVWPVYDLLGNRIEPFVLGLPFSFAWVAGWALLTFAVLVGYYLLCEGRD